MKRLINHEKLGTIVYEESLWTSNKSLSINGVKLQKTSKKTFVLTDKETGAVKTAYLEGSIVTGVTLSVDGVVVQLAEKSKWYEYAFSVAIFVLIMVWGNNPNLCKIIPVVGGAIGGGISGLGVVTSLVLMKNAQKPLFKILIWLGVTACVFLLCFLIAIAILGAMA